jgi:sugar lactone lactonase YvrE
MKPLLASSLIVLALVASVPARAADVPATASASAPSTQAAPRQFAVVTLGNPRSIAVDSNGNLYVGDADGGKVLKITPAGEVAAIGAAGASFISDPLGLAVDRKGAVYVADASGNGVYRIPSGGAAVTLPKPDSAVNLQTPTGVAVDAVGNVFVSNNAGNSILKITPDGVVSVFAGKSGDPGAADGAGSAASFVTPRGIAIDEKDNLYVADEGNSNIRKITPAGVVTTLAGAAGQTGSADGAGPAARFAAPRSLTAAADGTVYVADTDNHLIRKISPQGVVVTLAGKAGDSGNADGQGAAARFSEPRGIAVDAAGNVYVADTGNGAIRQITPAGVVTTIAGAAAPSTAPATSPAPTSRP